MGITLKVTPEVLIKMAEDIEKQIEDIANQFTQIESEIRTTARYWEGISGDKHRKDYDSGKEEVTKAVQRLKDHPANLLEMAGIYRETESAAENVSQGLSSDVII